MNNRRMTARWLKEERVNNEIPSQVEQVEKLPQDGQGVHGS